MTNMVHHLKEILGFWERKKSDGTRVAVGRPTRGSYCFPGEMMVSSTSCQKQSHLGYILKESQKDLLTDGR